MQDESELLAILERSTRTGIHVVGLRILTYATGFLGAILIARALGPAGRGEFALPVAVLMILFTLSNLGLEHAQIYLAGRGVSHRSLWANATRVGLKASVVTWAVVGLVLLSPWGSAPGLPLSWVVVTLVQLPLLLHVLYWLNILQLAGKVRAGIAAGAVAAGVETAIVAVMFATHQLTPFRVLVLTGIANALLWAIVLGIGLRAGLVAMQAEPSVFRRGLRFGLKAQLGMVFVFLLFRVDQVMVEHALGFRALGLYSLAVTLAELLWLLSDPFAAALLPRIRSTPKATTISGWGTRPPAQSPARGRRNADPWVTCPLHDPTRLRLGLGGAVSRPAPAPRDRGTRHPATAGRGPAQARTTGARHSVRCGGARVQRGVERAAPARDRHRRRIHRLESGVWVPRRGLRGGHAPRDLPAGTRSRALACGSLHVGRALRSAATRPPL